MDCIRENFGIYLGQFSDALGTIEECTWDNFGMELRQFLYYSKNGKNQISLCTRYSFGMQFEMQLG